MFSGQEMVNMTVSRYEGQFYSDRHGRTEHAAETILSLVLSRSPGIKSAVDVGCGVGTWLNVCERHGVDRIQGYDGPWVDREELVIPQERFSPQNLEEEIPSAQRFDLVISLEVAEHLPAEKAEHFVRQLTKLGDRVLFSAAIPGQGGVGHLNEQWPEYWTEKFGAHGFVPVDVIRHQIWTDTKIPVHYRQNTLIFEKTDARLPVEAEASPSPGLPLALVHPEVYLEAVEPPPPAIREALTGIKQSYGAFLGALVRRVARITR
jgi:SAM-dependent methyltransferase